MRHVGDQRRHCGRLHRNYNIQYECSLIFGRGKGLVQLAAVTPLKCFDGLCCFLILFYAFFFQSSVLPVLYFLENILHTVLESCCTKKIKGTRRQRASELEIFVVLALCCKTNTSLLRLKQSKMFIFCTCINSTDAYLLQELPGHFMLLPKTQHTSNSDLIVLFQLPIFSSASISGNKSCVFSVGNRIFAHIWLLKRLTAIILKKCLT